MTLLITGDFVPQHRILGMIRQGSVPLADSVLDAIRQTDYAVVNLEAPLCEDNGAKPISKTGPNLKAPLVTAKVLRQAGFHAVTLANNHFRDYGQAGVETTIEACRKAGLATVGGGRCMEDARRPLTLQLGGGNFDYPQRLRARMVGGNASARWQQSLEPHPAVPRHTGGEDESRPCCGHRAWWHRTL